MGQNFCEIIEEKVIIRFATKKDIDNIITFIKKYWKEDHIFVKDRAFFEYIYCTHPEKVNFVVGIGATSETLYGIRGFICSNSNTNPDTWGAIWKKAPQAPRGLGRQLQVYLLDQLKPRVLAGLGISKQGLIAREKLREEGGKLKHYYRLSDRNEYMIAVVKDKIIKPVAKEKGYDLVEIPTMELLKRTFNSSRYADRRFYKDDWYIERKYFKHPYYKYKVFGISKNNQKVFDSIIIGREVSYDSAKILRIVDFIGIDQDLKRLSHSLDRLIVDNKYEYVDFYQHGIPCEIMEIMGMTLRNERDNNIIPNYFEPFQQENIDLDFSATSIENLYVFKGDSDQDRPNTIL